MSIMMIDPFSRIDCLERRLNQRAPVDISDIFILMGQKRRHREIYDDELEWFADKLLPYYLKAEPFRDAQLTRAKLKGFVFRYILGTERR